MKNFAFAVVVIAVVAFVVAMFANGATVPGLG